VAVIAVVVVVLIVLVLMSTVDEASVFKRLMPGF